MMFSRLRHWGQQISGKRRPRAAARRPVGFSPLSVEVLEDRLTPSAVSWTGAGDGLNWGDARNWSTGQLPGTGDDVTINTQGPDIILHSSGNDSVHSLQSENALLLTGGSLSLAAASSVDNTLLLLNATLTSSGTLDVLNLTQSGGTLNGAGTVTVEGQWTCSGGTMSGPGHTVLGGTARLSNATLSGRVVDSDGTATVEAGSSVTFSNDAVWNNNADSTLVLPNGSSLGNFFAGTAAVNNAGLLQITGTGTNSTTVGVALNNTGTVSVQAGTLTLAGGGSGSGSFDLQGSAQLIIGAPYALLDGATFTGTGTVQVSTFNSLTVAGAVSLPTLTINGGTVTVTGSLTADNLSLLGGTLTGAGDVTVNSNFTWANGNLSGTGRTFLEGTSSLSGGFFSMLTDRTVNNDGTATLTGSGIDISGNGVWNNDAGATTVLQDGAGMDNFFAGPSAALNNAGLLQKTGAGTATIGSSVQVTNAAAGTVEVQAGTLSLGFFPGPLQTAGTVTIAAGGTFLVGNYTQTGGTTTLNGSLTVNNPFLSGAVTINGGSLSGSGTVNGNVVCAGEVDPGSSPGVLTINGNYTQTAAGTLVIEIGGLTVGSQYDRLVVTGSATLNGTLSVVLLSGFQPSLGDTFAVLTFNSHTGNFSSFTGLDLGDGNSLSPVFNPNGKELDLVTVPSG
jgi:hypothetical protein